MSFDELKEKALSLPYEPGVYIMRDKSGDVIYVGKAKKLKNRVSQYFQDTASHSPKTRTMVSQIAHFDVIVAATEFEALVLECSLIKQHFPKYNILLKDDKGYPYIRFNTKDRYPVMSVSSRKENDGAEYFGPFGSRGVANEIISSIRSTLKLPDCKKRFPRDIGKGRPCLNYHMDLCLGWCQEGRSYEDYLERVEQARQLLSGNYKKAADKIRQQMLEAADNLDFELAAGLRDRLSAVEALGKKQLVTAGKFIDTDVIGYAQTEAKACFSVLHFCTGNLTDKDYEVFSIPDDPEAAVSSLVKQYYINRQNVPRRVMLPFAMEDSELFEQLLRQQFDARVKLLVPQRGVNAKLIDLANKNALEEAERVTSQSERTAGTVMLLAKMLSIPTANRIESFDISNISGTDIVASMVVFENGKQRKSDYKKFKVEGLSGQDDYASMHQVVKRRFLHYRQADEGFNILPDVLLIDGGVNHAKTALEALRELDLSVFVVGMVKDNRHRTRALVTPDGKEIAIDSQPSVFSMIGTIQEETHRSAISFHRQLRSKRLKYSTLDKIAGVGPKRKQDLLRYFKSITAISNATVLELEHILPKTVAKSVFDYFHPQQ